MYHSNHLEPALVPDVDKVEAVEVICVDFGHKLLQVLSTSFNTDFELAKQLAEEKLRDILKQTSSLSQPGHHARIRSTEDYGFSPMSDMPHSSADMLDVVFNDAVSGHSPETVSVHSRSSPSMPQSTGFFDNFDQLMEDPAFFAMTGTTINNELSQTDDYSALMEESSLPNHAEVGVAISQLTNNMPASSLAIDSLPSAFGTIDPSSGVLDTLSDYSATSRPSTGRPPPPFLDDRGLFMSPNANATLSSNLTQGPIRMDTDVQGPTDHSSCYIATPQPSPLIVGVRQSVSRRRALVQVTPPLSVPPSPDLRSESHRFASAQDGPSNRQQKTSEQAATAEGFRPRFNMPGSESARSYVEEDSMVDTISAPVNLPPTPDSSEEAWDEPSELLSLSSQTWATDSPAHLPSPEEVLAHFNNHLGESKLQTSLLLTRLFYAIGSPDALRQLRHAIDLARKSSFPPMCKAGHDLATTVYALDQLDSMTTLSHILRRYYLVRLLEHRSRLERDHNTAKQAWKGSRRRLKYDCAKIDLMKSGGEAALAADENNRRHRPTYRSKSQALSDLMHMLYPGLEPLRESERSHDCSYSRKMAKLKNRLSCARNWFQLERMFSIGILALIPCAGKYSISIDQVEKLPTDTLRILLGYLQQHRGITLTRLSSCLSVKLYDVLTRIDLSHVFPFEEMNEDVLNDSLYDTDQLLASCHVGSDTEDLSAIPDLRGMPLRV